MPTVIHDKLWSNSGSPGSIQESSYLQCRSQAHPGVRVRDGHTYNINQAGTEGPGLSWDMSPGPLAGDGGGRCPRGGQFQPLRPMSWQDADRSRVVLLIWSPLDIYGWSLWRQNIGPDGLLLWSSTVVLRLFWFIMFFPREIAQALLKMSTRRKMRSGGTGIAHLKNICSYLVQEHFLLQTEGLTFEPC